MLVCELEEVEQKDGREVLQVMGNLDPETGMYSLQEASETEQSLSQHSETEQQAAASSYVIDMQTVHPSELDMPTLSLNWVARSRVCISYASQTRQMFIK